MNKALALFSTLICFITANSVAVILDDTSLPAKSAYRKYTCAAVAVRDNVFRYQKTATRLFTRPWLKRMYDRIYYLEHEDIQVQQKAFIQSVKEAATKCDSVDIFLLAHGNSMVYWLDDIEPVLKKKIRLVYNCGCGNYIQEPLWKQHGVKYYLAHTGNESYSPVFYYFFLKRWVNGCELNKSIIQSNNHTMLLLMLIGQSKKRAMESCAVLYKFKNER